MREYNIFISHSWSYEDAYEQLEQLLVDEPYFNFKDYSVPKDDSLTIHKSSYYESELRNKLREQMIHCSVVLIFAGVYATYSDSIKMEIEIAKELEKPIIAINPWGSERTSMLVQNNADCIVGWNARSIVKAIKELSDEE